MQAFLNQQSQERRKSKKENPDGYNKEVRVVKCYMYLYNRRKRCDNLNQISFYNKSLDVFKENQRKHLEELIAQHDEYVERQLKEKEEEKALRLKHYENVEEIKNNLDKILIEIKSIQMNLKIIDDLLKSKNITLLDIKEQVEENKHIDAEIYSTLVRIGIENEQQRIEASHSLSKLVEKGLNPMAQISTILSYIATLS